MARKALPVYHTDYLANQLARLGWDPIGEYISSINQLTTCINECADPVERGKLIEAQANLVEKIWKYCFPQKRSVEVKGEVEHKQTVALTQEQLEAVLEQDVFRRAIEVKAKKVESDPDEHEGEEEAEGQDPFTEE